MEASAQAGIIESAGICSASMLLTYYRRDLVNYQLWRQIFVNLRVRLLVTTHTYYNRIVLSLTSRPRLRNNTILIVGKYILDFLTKSVRLLQQENIESTTLLLWLLHRRAPSVNSVYSPEIRRQLKCSIIF